MACYFLCVLLFRPPACAPGHRRLTAAHTLLPPACRRALNVITAFAISMDAHRTSHIPLLAPHAAALERLLAQLQVRRGGIL